VPNSLRLSPGDEDDVPYEAEYPNDFEDEFE
jgi:hypothetical protein